MRTLLKVLAGVGALIALAAELSPDTAASNLSAWAKLLGLGDVPSWLSAQSADTYGLIIGATLMLLSIASLLILRWRKRAAKSLVSPTQTDEVSLAISDRTAFVQKGDRVVSASIAIEVLNESNRTIKGVFASFEEITPIDFDLRRDLKPLMGLPLRGGPREANGKSVRAMDLHPGQTARFEIATVLLEQDITLQTTLDQKVKDGMGNERYIGGTRRIELGRYKFVVVVRGEDAKPERISYEINTRNGEAHVRILEE